MPIDDEAFNISMRKFLKQLGVTSQQEIEKAVWAKKPGGNLKVRATVSIPELDLEHTVEGEIRTGD